MNSFALSEYGKRLFSDLEPKGRRLLLAALGEALPSDEARRLVERFEWHYTPKHGSWLNLAESELGVFDPSCGAQKCDLL